MTTEPTKIQETHPVPTIQRFVLGDFQTNCYIITQGEPEPGKPCWIIDCGYAPDSLLNAIDEQQLRVDALILTHAHADHIAGVCELRSRHPECPILLHEAEEEWLNDPMLNLSANIGLSVTAPSATRLLRGGEALQLEDMTWHVRHTPGHSPGGITLVHLESKAAMVGDTLFNGSVGRTDFPGSSMDTLARSIREQLYTLDPQTVCCPGHGPATTIEHEMATNPFVPGK
ncbi:MAG: MBL fold metallo-hydrolase [Phycisphaerales bacterium]|nr:MBL fold metallo-hydrolase [Phycisphaerales bacterium]